MQIGAITASPDMTPPPEHQDLIFFTSFASGWPRILLGVKPNFGYWHRHRRRRPSIVVTVKVVAGTTSCFGVGAKKPTLVTIVPRFGVYFSRLGLRGPKPDL